MSGELSIDSLDVSRHLKFIKDELFIQLGLDFANDSSNLEALVLYITFVGYLLQRQ